MPSSKRTKPNKANGTGDEEYQNKRSRNNEVCMHQENGRIASFSVVCIGDVYFCWDLPTEKLRVWLESVNFFQKCVYLWGNMLLSNTTHLKALEFFMRNNFVVVPISFFRLGCEKKPRKNASAKPRDNGSLEQYARSSRSPRDRGEVPSPAIAVVQGLVQQNAREEKRKRPVHWYERTLWRWWSTHRWLTADINKHFRMILNACWTRSIWARCTHEYEETKNFPVKENRAIFTRFLQNDR